MFTGMPVIRPYLSVVATARNDDHGANLLRRVQTFLNALVEQCARRSLPLELVLVDWNPPTGKPPLAEVLRWPTAPTFCARVLTVAPEIHHRYRHADALPLYQMIAKNAGIRRAEGEFILATNIDILFSDELMDFIAARNLDPGRMYRIDRHDAASDVPMEASVEEQLAWCRDHVIRVNARDVTFTLSEKTDLPAPLPRDIAAPESGIAFGRGWHAPQQRFGQLSRVAAGKTELILKPAQQPRTLLLETAPRAQDPVELRIHGAAVQIAQRCQVRIVTPPEGSRLTIQAVAEGGRPATLRVFRCEWDDAPPSATAPALAVLPAPVRRAARARETLAAGARFVSDWRRGDAPGIGLPFSSDLIKRLGLHVESDGVWVSFERDKTPELPPPAEVEPAPLHTNACGDFTLLHRNHWMELRGYPEFDLYSMNIDSVLCYMAHYGGAEEYVLRDPMRIYHIEHAAGSGWTPEGQRLLFQRLAAKGIPWIEFAEVLGWATQMERLRTTMVFNREDWGLAGFQLPEINPAQLCP
jgi:hypothetical protein